MLVDSHTHVSEKWFEPVETLLYQMDRNGIDRAVLVQFSGEYDNGYILDSVKKHADRLAAVVSIDENRPTAVEDLTRLAESGAAGVRLRPHVRTPSDDPYTLWRAAESLGLVISCLGGSDDYLSADFARLLDETPRLTFVLEHLGELRRKSVDYTREKAAAVFSALLDRPNVLVKVHGLGEGTVRRSNVDEGPFEEHASDKVTCAYEMLGSDRLMWGSDFPPSSGREGYANTRRYLVEALQGHGMPPTAEERIFGQVANQVFFRQGG
jgi:L-fuconolactonase